VAGEANPDTGAVVGESAARFDHSDRQLSLVAAPTDEQRASIAAQARAISDEIGAKFDAEAAQQTPAISSMFADMRAYAVPTMPWGASPVPPPIALFQQLAMALNHWLSTCRSYEHDALTLSLAGVPDFKMRLQAFVADASQAMDKIHATWTGGMATSPANWGAPPGPMSPFPPGMGFPAMMPMPPMPAFPPMPFFPQPFPPPPFGMNFGAVPPWPMPPPFPAAPGFPPPSSAPSAADLAIMRKAQQDQFDIMQQMHRDQVSAFDKMNDKFNAYLKS
jgi:hypothetical protein